MTIGEKFWIKIWANVSIWNYCVWTLTNVIFQAYNHQDSIVSLIVGSFDSWSGGPSGGMESGQRSTEFNVPQPFRGSQNTVVNISGGVDPLLADVQDAVITRLPSVHTHPLFYVGVFTSIGLVTVALSIAMNAAQLSAALRASRALFSRLLRSVMFATIRFHDTTPTGESIVCELRGLITNEYFYRAATQSIL
jgi:ABC-type multidrug transport system fused ATPase/permease subunit